MKKPAAAAHKVWHYSLWLTAPLALLITVWLWLGWQRFSHVETTVLPEYSQTLTATLDYQAKQLIKTAVDKSFRTKPQIAPFIQELQIFAAQRDLNRLQSDLPQSGKRYIKGRLSTNEGDFKIRLRHRGNGPLHWRGDKRSLRIRLENKKLWQSINTFELMVPADKSIVGSYLTNRLAKNMGLLVSTVKLVWLNLNGEPRGLYLLVETITEQTLINNKQMPGDIYAGEVANRDAFIGADNRLFKNAGLWQKLAFNSDYPEQNDQPLQLLVKWLNADKVNYARLARLVDYPQFARFTLFNQLVAADNIDQFHNWRLYFDHSKGRFFPMVWDAEGWPIQQLFPEQNRLNEVLLADPVFKRELEKQFQQLDSKGLLDEFQQFAAIRVEDLIPWVAADPYSSIDLAYYDAKQYRQAAGQMLERMKIRFKKVIFKAAKLQVTAMDEQIWQGEQTFEGINHIRHPVKILPGSQLSLAAGALLVFHQKLVIAGSADQPVRIVAADDKPFAAVVIKGEGANGSRLNHCHFNGGSKFKNAVVNFTAMLSLHEVTDVSINNCLFEKNQDADDMVHGVYTDFNISNSRFEGAFADALDLELSNAVIENSTFADSGREGLDTMYSDVVVRHSRFVNNQDTALSVGQKSRIRLENSLLQGSQTAFLVKDGSVLRVTNSTIKDNQRIAELKQSNDHYREGGLAFIYHSRLFDNLRYFDVEKNSALWLFDSYLAPDYRSSKKRIKIDKYSDSYQPTQSKAQMILSKTDLAQFKTLDLQQPLMLDSRQRGMKNVSR